MFSHILYYIIKEIFVKCALIAKSGYKQVMNVILFNKCLTNVKQFCLEKVNKNLQMKNKH